MQISLCRSLQTRTKVEHPPDARCCGNHVHDKHLADAAKRFNRGCEKVDDGLTLHKAVTVTELVFDHQLLEH